MWARKAIIVIAVLGAGAVQGQTDIDVGPFSGRIFPELLPTIGAKGLTKPTTYFVAPLLVSTDGAKLGQLTAGVAFSELAAPTSFSVTYSRIKPDAGDSLNAFGASVKSNVWKGNTAGINVLGSYSDTREASTKVQAGAILDAALGDAFTAGVDLRWVHTSARDGVSDLVPKFVAGYNFGPARLGADYTLDNDVNGQSDYSVAVNIPTSDTFSITLGAGKNSSIFLNLYRKF